MTATATASRERVLESSINGQRIRILRSAAESGGAELLMESTFRPHGAPPPDHFHPTQREHFEVLDGTLSVRLDGVVRTMRAGESFDVPGGAVHAMWNAGDDEARVLWAVRPALRTEQLLEQLFAVGRGDGRRATVPVKLLQTAVLLDEYAAELQLAKPPRAVQRLLLTPLALLGRALGYGANRSG
jgi:quercetin dioxygenase-like cupin family protein